MVDCQTEKQLICKEEKMQEGKNVTLELLYLQKLYKHIKIREKLQKNWEKL